MADQEVDMQMYLMTFVESITEGFTEEDKASSDYKAFGDQLSIIINGAVSRYYDGDFVSKPHLHEYVLRNCLQYYPKGFDKLMKSSLLDSTMFKLVKNPPFKQCVLINFLALKDSDSIDMSKLLKEKLNGVNCLHTIAYDLNILYFKEIMESLDEDYIKESLKEIDSERNTPLQNAIMCHTKFAVYLIKSDMVDMFDTEYKRHPILSIASNKIVKDRELLVKTIIDKYGKKRIQEIFTPEMLKNLDKLNSSLLFELYTSKLCDVDTLLKYQSFHKAILTKENLNEYKNIVKTMQFKNYIISGTKPILTAMTNLHITRENLKILLDYHGEAIFKIKMSGKNIIHIYINSKSYAETMLSHESFPEELLTEKSGGENCVLYYAFFDVKLYKLKLLVKHKSCKKYVENKLEKIKKFLLKDGRKVNILLEENMLTKDIIDKLNPELIERMYYSSFPQNLINLLKSDLIPIIDETYMINDMSILYALTRIECDDNGEDTEGIENCILDKVTKEQFQYVSPSKGTGSVLNGILTMGIFHDYENDMIQARLKKIFEHKYFSREFLDKSIISMSILASNKPDIMDWAIDHKYVPKDYFSNNFYEGLALNMNCIKMLEKNKLLTEDHFQHVTSNGNILYNVSTEDTETVEYIINHKFSTPEFLSVKVTNDHAPGQLFLSEFCQGEQQSDIIMNCKNVTPKILMEDSSDGCILSRLYPNCYETMLKSIKFTKEVAVFPVDTVHDRINNTSGKITFACYMISNNVNVEFLNKVLSCDYVDDCFTHWSMYGLFKRSYPQEFLEELSSTKYFTKEVLEAISSNLLDFVDYPEVLNLIINHRLMDKELFEKIMYTQNCFDCILGMGVSETISYLLQHKFLDVSELKSKSLIKLALQNDNSKLLKSVFSSIYKTKEDFDDYIKKENNAIVLFPFIKNEEIIDVILNSEIQPYHLKTVLHEMLSSDNFGVSFANWSKLTTKDLKLNNQFCDNCVSACYNNMEVVEQLINNGLIDKELLMFDNLDHRYLFLETCKYNAKTALKLMELDFFDEKCFKVVDHDNRNCLHYAALYQNQLLPELCKSKYCKPSMFDIDITTNTVIHYVAEHFVSSKVTKFMKGNEDIIKKYIYRKNKKKTSPLIIAAKHNHRFIKFILKMDLTDSPLSGMTNDYRTILHIGCRYNSNTVEEIGKSKKYKNECNMIIKIDDEKVYNPIVIACQYNPRSLQMLIKYFDIISVIKSYKYGNNYFDPYLLIGVQYQPSIINIFKKLGKRVFKILKNQENSDGESYNDSEFSTFRDNLEMLPNIRNKCIADHSPPEMECQICYDYYENVQFDCGHRCCIACAANVKECHVCREEIKSISTLAI